MTIIYRQQQYGAQLSSDRRAGGQSETSLRENLKDIDFDTLRLDLIEDDFHNNRTTNQLKASFNNSFISIFAMDGQRCIGTARALSDEICNCYVVDVWTQSEYRGQGIATRMMNLIIDRASGQHVYLQTDDAQAFYLKLGFQPQPEGMFKISGEWLNPRDR